MRYAYPAARSVRIEITIRLLALLALLIGLTLLVDGHMSEPLRGVVIGVLGFSAGDMCARLKRKIKKVRLAVKSDREEAQAELEDYGGVTRDAEAAREEGKT